MLQFGEASARRVETSYLTPDVVEQRRQVIAALGLQRGESVLDIGSGPGLLAVEMAAAVGSRGRVSGTDISPSMLALAADRSIPADAAPVEFQRAGVDALPFPDDSFDAAVSTQVLEYVEVIPGALTEMHRVLRPGGRALVLDTDWDSIVWHSGDVPRMRRVLAVWDEHLIDPHLPRTLLGSLQRAGFDVERPWIIPLFNVGYAEATYSGGLIPTIAAYVTGRGGLTAEVIEAWAADLRALGPAYFFSLNRYVFLAHKPG
ncbi:MAG: methyltransferase domain-containing protein [Geodermatophilaceae bacterium]|jgi:SAM-dependent methyltransferase|nr:methyltransferase domain-containing protein [Geodermatophilaceae bacterium]